MQRPPADLAESWRYRFSSLQAEQGHRRVLSAWTDWSLPMLPDSSGAGLGGEIALITIQPTPFCNIDCSYCYLKNRSDRGVIATSTISRIFQEIWKLKPRQTELQVSWHAGEPTVLPPTWYEEAFALVRAQIPDDVAIFHGFQTNAVLLTDEWCRLLARDDVSVGVSIDGPREIHDANRKTRSGAGTFDKAMAGIERLRAHNIPFHVITVLTAQSLAHPQELFAFYDSIGVNMINFNFEEIEGVHRTSSLADPSAIEAYKRFLAEFFALTRSAGKDWSVREVSAIYGQIFNEGEEAPGNPQAIPGSLLTFDYKGNVSTFSPELLTSEHPKYGNFILGNVHDRPLSEMLTSNKVATIAADIAEGIAQCQTTCSYFNVCGGGAPSSKLCENGSFATAETMHCRFRIKATTDVVLGMTRSAISRAFDPAAAQ